MERIIKNAIRCLRCGQVIESKTVHDFVTCACGACSVDGGTEYLRRMAPSRDAFQELAVTEPAEG